MISITAAIFICQLVVCDITGCGSHFNNQWKELIENIEAKLTDCYHAEVRRIDKPNIVWYINAAAASYGWNDELVQMTVYRRHP